MRTSVRLLRSDLPLGILSDIIAHALDLPALIKQNLLRRARVRPAGPRLLHLLHVLTAVELAPGRLPSAHFSLN